MGPGPGDTFDIIHLNDMFMYGIMKIGLLPSKTYFTSRNLLKSNLWRRWDIEAQFLDQNIV